MKILLTVSHTGIHTGASVQLAQLAEGLAGRGHSVSILLKKTSHDDGDRGERLERLIKAGVRIGRYKFRKLKYRGTIKELLRLRKFLKKEAFDVVHCFKGADFNFILLSSIGVYIPVFIVYRGMGAPLDFFNSFKYRSRKVDKIIAVSEATRQTVIRSGRVAPDKIEVIYSGVNLGRFDPNLDGGDARDELGIPRDAPVAGIVGSFDFRPNKTKGGHEFAHAASIVLTKRPDAYFLCVGGINIGHFKPLGDELGISDRFVFTGYRNDVPRMLSAMDVSVCSSIRPEGLMGAVRESLAMAVPVVSTDVGGNSEIVRDGETGHIVPPGDSEALAEGILKLIDNPQKAREMGGAGRELVEGLCGSEGQISRVEALYASQLRSSSVE